MRSQPPKSIVRRLVCWLNLASGKHLFVQRCEMCNTNGQMSGAEDWIGSKWQ